MKKIFGLSFLLTGFLLSAHSQIKSVKGHCGLYYKNMETLHKQQGAALGFYQFKPGQTIASIGAQCCHWEAAYAAASDSLHFWLEDIDSSSFNERQASFAWNYYDSLRGRPMTSTYQLILGDEKKTNLPDQAFDKILIINSFHEFSDQKEMLADIRKKLKPGGILYIDEALARKSGDLHGVCKKPIYLSEELIAILKTNGFEYINGLDKQFRKSKPSAKIFAFRKIVDRSSLSGLFSELVGKKRLLTTEFWKKNISEIRVFGGLDTSLLTGILYCSNGSLRKYVIGDDINTRILSQIDYKYFPDRLEMIETFFPPFYESYFRDKIYIELEDGSGAHLSFQRNNEGKVILKTTDELIDDHLIIEKTFDEVAQKRRDSIMFKVYPDLESSDFITKVEKDSEGNKIVIEEDKDGTPKRKFKYYYTYDGLLKKEEFYNGNTLWRRNTFEYIKPED